MNHRQQEELIRLLLQVPGLKSYQARGTLLGGIPNADSLSRDENNMRTDITLLVSQLAPLRLTTGEQALLILLDNALPYVRGLTLETELRKLREKLPASFKEESKETSPTKQARKTITSAKVISRPEANAHAKQPVVSAAASPERRNHDVRQQWSAGKPVLIGKRIYILRDCVEEPLMPQNRLYVWRQAYATLDPASVSDRGLSERYRIKQVAFQSIIFAEDEQQRVIEILSQEAALLRELNRAREKYFPRYIDFYDREPEWAALVFTATADKDKTLATIHGIPQEAGAESRPIGGQRARLLLESVPALCTMLAALHRRNIAHRDLTPETLLHIRDRQGSRLVLRDLGRATHPKEREGHLDYAAPEQVRASDHANIGPATDIYQLGAVLYRLLCGKAPDRTSWGIEPPSIANPDLPEALNAILLQALAEDYSRRWSSIEAFGAALSATAPLIKLR